LGIDLDFAIQGQENNQKIDELFNQNVVQVYDPFSRRSYKASLNQLSHRYQVGHPEQHYTAEIRELDMPPEFEVLEIEGHQFPVSKYIETDANDTIGRHALLRLSKEQFIELQNLIKPGSVQIRRMGVDEKPITVRYGGLMHWSEHKEGEEIYYKQIVRFFPPDLPSSRIDVASGAQQEVLVEMTQALTVRFEALVQELFRNNIISEEKRDEILGEKCWNLLGSTRLNEICWQIDRVPDALEYLDLEC